MVFTSRAIEFGRRVEAMRAEQMELAEQALLARPETRRLLEGRDGAERADAERDPGACFAAPSAACLLAEASESAKAIHRDRFRDWVLGEIVAAQAAAGLGEAAFETAAPHRRSAPRHSRPA